MASGFTSDKHRIKRSKKLSIAQATELTEKMALVFGQIKDPRVARTRANASKFYVNRIWYIGAELLRIKKIFN